MNVQTLIQICVSNKSAYLARDEIFCCVESKEMNQAIVESHT